MTRTAPFESKVADEAIADLRTRLGATRWPDELPGVGWDYGVPSRVLRDLCDAWAQHDIDAFVDRCNRWAQVRGRYSVDNGPGVQIHAIHARSPHPQARPLVLVHGWPGSVVEFFDVIEPLLNPPDPNDAFHVIVPSLPGYGLSGVTTRRGVDAATIATVVDALVADLGYEHYLVFGGDWGSVAGMALGALFPQRVRALHLTMINVPAPPKDEREALLTDSDRQLRTQAQQFGRTETGYQAIQSTRPQTLAYGLTDSPAGLAAWIAEKFHAWTDRRGALADAPFGAVPLERLLDNLSMYWFTGTINSSMRLYYEVLGGARLAQPLVATVPVGHTRYPAEIYTTPRGWAERALHLEYWHEPERGGHFPSLEVPDLFVHDLRNRYRAYR
ncbi:MAG: epoxide hydrolase [Actinomycetota bacterium]|nr:epoxide hydrolase [Actinomycetota bacterium]